MHYIVLDLEWNQPISREKFITEPVKLRGEIVQIGAVKLDESFNTVDTFDIMISPRHYRIMNRKVMELTGIHTSDIRHALPFPTAFRRFLEFCGEDWIMLTWGCDDVPMLKDNLTLHGLPHSLLPRHYDVQPIFDHQVTREKRQCSLTYAMEVLNEPPFTAHNALNDALSTAVVCRHLDMIAGFLGYDDITRSSKLPTVAKTFTKFASILSDDEVNTVVCPECKRLLTVPEWISCRRGKLMGTNDCDCGGKFITYLFCIKSKDGAYRVSRKMAPRSESDDVYYERKKLQYREYRAKKEKTPVNA